MRKRASRHLSIEAVLAIHAEVLEAHGGGEGLRSRELLESAVAAPQATFGGEALFTDPVDVAATYLFYLCRNQAFVDGDKRTALAACLVFLAANGRLPAADLPERHIDAWETLVLDIAASRLDREGAAERLKALLRKRG